MILERHGRLVEEPIDSVLDSVTAEVDVAVALAVRPFAAVMRVSICSSICFLAPSSLTRGRTCLSLSAASIICREVVAAVLGALCQEQFSGSAVVEGHPQLSMANRLTPHEVHAPWPC